MFLIPKSPNLRLQPGLQMLGSGGQILPTCLALYMEKHGISSKNRRKVYQIEKQSKLKWDVSSPEFFWHLESVKALFQVRIMTFGVDWRRKLVAPSGWGEVRPSPIFVDVCFFFGKWSIFGLPMMDSFFFQRDPATLSLALGTCVFLVDARGYQWWAITYFLAKLFGRDIYHLT